ALALGRPLITAESPALYEFLTPGEHLLTVPADDAAALANTIQVLLDNPQEQQRLCYNARQHIENNFLPEHIGKRLKIILETIIQDYQT
ncbi:MAG: glycosyltransferase, partial [Aggregatilineales bacterium]